MLKKLFFIILLNYLSFANNNFKQAVLSYKSGNKIEASKLFEKACNNDHITSCYNLAVMSKTGDGIEVNLEKSIPLLIKSCNGGIYKACYNLGILYNEGDGVIKNIEEAIKYLDIACNNSFNDACFLVGYSYMIGEDGIKDKLTAKQYFQKCCKAHNPNCCKYSKDLENEGY